MTLLTIEINPKNRRLGITQETIDVIQKGQQFVGRSDSAMFVSSSWRHSLLTVVAQEFVNQFGDDFIDAVKSLETFDNPVE